MEMDNGTRQDHDPGQLRSVGEIQTAEEEVFSRAWLARHEGRSPETFFPSRSADPQITTQAAAAAERVRAAYPDEPLAPYSDYEWGLLMGKLAALRWVLGAEWDMLDT